MKRFTWILLICAAFSGVMLGGCGPSEEPIKPIENPEKGEGTSADGAANQSGAAEAQDATQ
jgi:hypothetical protein